MINFIVCEDNDMFLKKNINTINNIMFSNNYEYKVYSFKNYNKELQELIENNLDNKIYILDIELEDCSGIDIARKIRKNDWNSIIIFSTAHYELFMKVFSDKLMILDYISKFDDYENNLAETIMKSINIINKNNCLIFKSDSEYHNLKFSNILYLMYDKFRRKTIIKSIDKEYFVNKTLISFKENLDNNFVQINRSYIINKSNIKKINYKEKRIEFINGKILENVAIKKENS